MRPTLKDVAKIAGVNFTLVSKYINGNPQARMKKETQERIERAIQELGYRPSAAARALRYGKSKTVGLVSGTLTNAYQAHIADFMLGELHQLGYQLLIAVSTDNGEADAVQSLLSREVDGIIAITLENPVPVILPCPLIICDKYSDHCATVNLDKTNSLIQALKSVSGRIAGMFFGHSLWRDAFSQVCDKLNLDYDNYQLSFDRQKRWDELGRVCQLRPDYIFTNGWETLSMLVELLDEHFPDYSPRLFLHANCTGAFLRDSRIEGIIYSSSHELVRQMCSTIVRQIENSSQTAEHILIPTSYIPVATAEYNALISKHFSLT